MGPRHEYFLQPPMQFHTWNLPKVLRFSKPSVGQFLKVCSFVTRSSILGKCILSASFGFIFWYIFSSLYIEIQPRSHISDLITITNLNAAVHQRGQWLVSQCSSLRCLQMSPAEIVETDSSFSKDMFSTLNSTSLNDLWFNYLMNFVPLV